MALPGVNFEFATVTRIIFGAGALQKIGPLAAELGQRALVVTGVGRERSAVLRELLSASGIESDLFSVTGEPTVTTIEEAVAAARTAQVQMLIGFGGGSALDTAKAVAALVVNPGPVTDYLEVVGLGKALQQVPLPFIAIPTTAGTGSEVTRNAVVGVPQQRVKVSLRSPHMLARLALVDPQLTYSLSPEVTASTGLDALTQVIEPYVSNRTNPLTDALCREAMQRAARSLYRAFQDGENAAAREDLCITSLFGGLALANARLGAVHGFAGPLGGMFPAPHGAVCARLLPFVTEINLRALQQRQPDNPSVERYADVARILTGNQHASAADGVAWLHRLCRGLQIPALSDYGLKAEDFSQVVASAGRASSMQGNPIQLTEQELIEILERAS